jgi:hypothetical protein
MRAVPCRALALPARSEPRQPRSAHGGAPAGRSRPQTREERRGEEESAEGRGRGREKVWGKNFNAD